MCTILQKLLGCENCLSVFRITLNSINGLWVKLWFGNGELNQDKYSLTPISNNNEAWDASSEPGYLFCVGHRSCKSHLDSLAAVSPAEDITDPEVVQICCSVQGTCAVHPLSTSWQQPAHLLSDECYFQETLEENHYNSYRSEKFTEYGWYVGLKRNGKVKPGPKTAWGQKAVLFLPLHMS
uniref:Fibroblast growth factor 1 n=1 Tax=Eptatretus burgeri TaxID=7764 RepID=A0A8C4QUM4_EPTBU